MRGKDFIPRQEVAFLTWASNFLEYLFPSLEQFDFPEEVYQELKALYEDFDRKFTIAFNPGTRTSVSVYEKNYARKILEKNMRQQIKEHLTYNQAVSDVDRTTLGLPIHKTSRTPAPVAETHPGFEVDTSCIRRLIIHFHDQGFPRSKAKPPGVHGATIRWAIRDEPPVNISDLMHVAFATRTPCILDFETDCERGKTVYLCLCWENIRGKQGPWSAIKKAIIP
jgi:hypothetical protein